MDIVSCFSSSYFFTAVSDIIFGLVSSMIIALASRLLLRKRSADLKINFNNIFTWSLIFALPIILSDIVNEYNLGIILILLFCIFGAIFSYVSQVKKYNLYRLFQLKRYILYIVIILYVTIIGIIFLIDKLSYKYPELDPVSKEMLLLSDHFLVKGYRIIESSVYDYEQTANIRLIDSTFSWKVSFEVDFLYQNKSLIGANSFLDKFSVIKKRLRQVDFLWDYIHSNNNSGLIVHFSDSTLTDQRITWLLDDYNDFRYEKQSIVQLETFLYFESTPLDSVKSELEKNKFFDIIRESDNILQIELIDHNGTTDWILTNKGHIYLVKKRGQYFLKTNFSQSIGFERIDKLIEFDFQGNIIDSNFAGIKQNSMPP